MMVDPKALKRSPIYWTPEGTLAFNETTIAVSRCPLMYFINDDSPIKLSLMRPITVSVVCYSKSSMTCGDRLPFISVTQTNWSTIQKEAYAIFYCCQQLDYLIRDRKLTIHTDHINLTFVR